MTLWTTYCPLQHPPHIWLSSVNWNDVFPFMSRYHLTLDTSCLWAKRLKAMRHFHLFIAQFLRFHLFWLWSIVYFSHTLWSLISKVNHWISRKSHCFDCFCLSVCIVTISHYSFDFFFCYSYYRMRQNHRQPQHRPESECRVPKKLGWKVKSCWNRLALTSIRVVKHDRVDEADAWNHQNRSHRQHQNEKLQRIQHPAVVAKRRRSKKMTKPTD